MATWREKKVNEIYFGIFASDTELDEIDEIVRESEREFMNIQEEKKKDELAEAAQVSADDPNPPAGRRNAVKDVLGDLAPMLKGLPEGKAQEITDACKIVARVEAKISKLNAEAEMARAVIGRFKDGVKALNEQLAKDIAPPF